MLTWRQLDVRFGGPEYRLISGRIPVGVAGYNQSRSKGDGPESTYRWHLTVPGNERKGYAADLDSAKAAAELAFGEWCEAAGLRR